MLYRMRLTKGILSSRILCICFKKIIFSYIYELIFILRVLNLSIYINTSSIISFFFYGLQDPKPIIIMIY